MAIFKNPNANALFAAIRQYVLTGDNNFLPPLSHMIQANPNILFYERDEQSNSLFFHLLNLPQIAPPEFQLSLQINLFLILLKIHINPLSAMIAMEHPATLANALHMLQGAVTFNIISRQTLFQFLFNNDISGKSPAETAIIANDAIRLTMYFNSLLYLLHPNELTIFSRQKTTAGNTLLELIELHADSDTLFAYVDFLRKGLGVNNAFATLHQQTTSRNQIPPAPHHFDAMGEHHLQWAMTIFQKNDVPQKKWETLLAIYNAMQAKLHEWETQKNFNFRLFAPPFAPCDPPCSTTNNPIIADEEKSESVYWLPNTLLDDEPEEVISSSLTLR